MKLLDIFATIRARDLASGIGHKAAAPILGLGLGRTTTRYALMAFRNAEFHAAVTNGVLQEAGVMKPLLALPEAVRKQLLRVETKLGRTLTRSRAEKLVAAWSRLHQAPAALAISTKACSTAFPCRGPVARGLAAPPAPAGAFTGGHAALAHEYRQA